MSTVVFISQRKPEKKLIQELTYRYHPDSQMKEQILAEVAKHLNQPLDKFIVEVDVKVLLKEYDSKNT